MSVISAGTVGQGRRLRGGHWNGHKKAPAVKTTMQMLGGEKLSSFPSTWRKMECTSQFSGEIFTKIITKF